MKLNAEGRIAICFKTHQHVNKKKQKKKQEKPASGQQETIKEIVWSLLFTSCLDSLFGVWMTLSIGDTCWEESRSAGCTGSAVGDVSKCSD